MGHIEIIKKDSIKGETLRIHKSKGTAEARLRVLKFIDEDTEQHILYIPSFKLSAYGETIEKAEEMIKLAIEDYFEYLLSLTTKKILAELNSLFWTKTKFKNKEYSRAYVDLSGDLNDFNIQSGKVEESLLCV